MVPHSPRPRPRRASLMLVATCVTLTAACDSSDADSPDLVSISPKSGNVGTRVWFNGYDFAPGASVYFGSVPADSVEYVQATLLGAWVPDGIEPGGVYDVEVRNPDGSGASLPQAYRVRAPDPPSASAETPGAPAATPARRPSGEQALLGTVRP